jgi:hypothetical protein
MVSSKSYAYSTASVLLVEGHLVKHHMEYRECIMTMTVASCKVVPYSTGR